MRFIGFFSAILLIALPVSTQTPQLVKDINIKTGIYASSYPVGINYRTNTPADNFKYPMLGKQLYFSARTPATGAELYASDGKPDSVKLVADINPGQGNSSPGRFIVFKGKLYFHADDGKCGAEVWCSDGTKAGTTLFHEGYPGSGNGYFYNPMIMGDKLLWCSAGAKGYTLWISDGTAAGTSALLTGLSGYWYYPIQLGKAILFRGGTYLTGLEPYITDGTKAGTHLLKELNPGSKSGYFYYPVVYKNLVYFWGDDGAKTLWKSDGTSIGTVKVGKPAGFASYYWSNPTVIAGKIFFSAKTTSLGTEMWESDGTLVGTKLFKDLAPGSQSGYFSSPVPFLGKIFFSAYDWSGSTIGKTIWCTDGTLAGTKLISKKSKSWTYPTVVGNTLFFAGGGNAGYELWKTDGTDSGTALVADLNSGSSSAYPKFLTAFNGLLYFQGNGGHTGTELWMSDGTATGTKMVQDLYPNSGCTMSSSPDDLVDMNGTVFFTAYDGVNGKELWKSDGTAKGTVMVKDINPGTGSGADMSESYERYWDESGDLRRPIALGKRLFFRGNDGKSGYEIWVTDGTAAGTMMVKDIYAGPDSGWFFKPVVLGKQVYFCARDANGYAIWKSDGTTAGTVKVTNKGLKYDWDYPLQVGNLIIFRGYDPLTGYEPWISDGTDKGTRMLADLNPGKDSGYFYTPMAAGKLIYFKARQKGNYYSTLWCTDLTTSGTIMLARPTTGSMGDRICALGHGVVFQGYDATHGYEPWFSDGTQAGTGLLMDINPGKDSSYYNHPCSQKGKVYFYAKTPKAGTELWSTDGTGAGTVMVLDINPGKDSSYPRYLTPVGARLIYFAATDGKHGTELWVSDGTTTGTKMVGDIYTGSGGSLWRKTCLSKGKLFFGASTPTYGTELYVYQQKATNQNFGFSTSTNLVLTADDPVINSTWQAEVSNAPWLTFGVILFGAPDDPIPCGPGFFNLNTRRIFLAMPFAPDQSGYAGFTFKIPDSKELLGAQFAIQAFICPTANKPYGFDLTNSLLLHCGK